jgi:hypothetical protein
MVVLTPDRNFIMAYVFVFPSLIRRTLLDPDNSWFLAKPSFSSFSIAALCCVFAYEDISRAADARNCCDRFQTSGFRRRWAMVA